MGTYDYLKQLDFPEFRMDFSQRPFPLLCNLLALHMHYAPLYYTWLKKKNNQRKGEVKCDL